MMIHDVHKGIQKRKGRKRVGRGMGSGHGRTSGRGDKGHSSRSGFSFRLGHEGGQMPLQRRVAKRGFSNNYFSKKVAIVNLAALESVFDAGSVVDPEALLAKGLVKGRHDLIKILGNGNLTKKLTVKAQEFSQSAVDKITAAGGQVERL